MANVVKNGIDLATEQVKAGGKKPRLLLHTCCGPCLCGVLSNIYPYFEVTAYFFNPNIRPDEEFALRLDALKTVVAHFEGVKLIVPSQYEEMFLTKVRGLEALKEGGARCEICFDLRLSNTAEYLSLHSDEFDCFATTLTVSPHKNATLVNEVGERAAEKFGVRYLCSDFKKKDGFLNSIRLSKELGIYRQNYCGCNFGI